MSDLVKMEFTKVKVALRYWLLARSQSDARYLTPMEAFEFAALRHTGTRKNGAPELIHQVEIAQYLRTLEPHLIDAPLCLSAAMLHDVREDYHVPHLEIHQRFGEEPARVTELLTKCFMGVSKSDKNYYHALSLDPCGSIVKGSDRLHNHGSMAGAFSVEKQLSYLLETEQLVLPMLKAARRNFPSQEPAYENLKIALRSQIAILRPALEMIERLQAEMKASAA